MAEDGRIVIVEGRPVPAQTGHDDCHAAGSDETAAHVDEKGSPVKAFTQNGTDGGARRPDASGVHHGVQGSLLSRILEEVFNGLCV